MGLFLKMRSTFDIVDDSESLFGNLSYWLPIVVSGTSTTPTAQNSRQTTKNREKHQIIDYISIVTLNINFQHMNCSKHLPIVSRSRIRTQCLKWDIATLRTTMGFFILCANWCFRLVLEHNTSNPLLKCEFSMSKRSIMEFLGVWAPLARGRILVVGSADVF